MKHVVQVGCLTMPNKGDEVMRNFCAKCVYIVILQFIFSHWVG